MCHTYFKEMVRVLDKDGVFMIVSLLQPHVLNIIFDYFVKGENPECKSNLFNIKFQQIQNIKGYAEKQFIKYFVSIKKNTIDTSNDKMVQMKQNMQDLVHIQDNMEQKELKYTSENAIEKIKTDQQMYMINPDFKSLHKARQIIMNCYDFASEDNNKVPKYIIHMIDSDDIKLLITLTCACIIVP